jgi:hypothetical protein
MFNGSNGGYSLADIAAATAGGNGNNDGFGWGGNGGWWIIIFLLALGGGWGNGWGGGGAGNNGTTAVVGREVSYGFDMNNLENGIRGIQNGLCDVFYAMNNGLMTTTAQLQSTLAQGFGGINTALLGMSHEAALGNLQNTNAITAQLTNMAANNAQCCCETKNLINSNFADLSYRMATQDCQTRQTITDATRDIIASQEAGFRAVLDRMTTDRISALENENQALKLTQSQSNQNAFLISQLAPKAIPAYIAPNPYTGAYGAAPYTTSGCGANYGVTYGGCGC